LLGLKLDCSLGVRAQKVEGGAKLARARADVICEVAGDDAIELPAVRDAIDPLECFVRETVEDD
tara:strand:- start:180 stop:371 length:192 start_codon:yes stop_codon:yes gene_type:complete